MATRTRRAGGVVAGLRVIQRELHEAREGHRAGGADLIRRSVRRAAGRSPAAAAPGSSSSTRRRPSRYGRGRPTAEPVTPAIPARDAARVPRGCAHRGRSARHAPMRRGSAAAAMGRRIRSARRRSDANRSSELGQVASSGPWRWARRTRRIDDRAVGQPADEDPDLRRTVSIEEQPEHGCGRPRRRLVLARIVGECGRRTEPALLDERADAARRALLQLQEPGRREPAGHEELPPRVVERAAASCVERLGRPREVVRHRSSQASRAACGHCGCRRSSSRSSGESMSSPSRARSGSSSTATSADRLQPAREGIVGGQVRDAARGSTRPRSRRRPTSTDCS